MLGSDEQRAWYGPDHVALAIDRGAVGTLLISDELFRASDPVLRKKYVTLVEDVRDKGGEVLMFSSMHESGQREYPTRMTQLLEYPLIYSPHCRTQPDNGHCCDPHISAGRGNCGSGREGSEGGGRKEKERRRRWRRRMIMYVSLFATQTILMYPSLYG